jgi:hypothetical protein
MTEIPWKIIGTTQIYRENCFSFGFDNMCKCYRLYSNEEQLSIRLYEGYYLDFYYEFKNIIFLRQILDRSSWPTTTFVSIDLQSFESKALFTSESSYMDWPVESVTATTFDLVTQKPRQGFEEGYHIDVSAGINIHEIIFTND